MARIKTALELALERTKDIEGDSEKVKEFEFKQKGKRLSGEVLDDIQLFEGEALEAELENRLSTFAKDLKKIEKIGEGVAAFKEGALEILSSQIKTPEEAGELSRVKLAIHTLALVLNDKSFELLGDQVMQILLQFLEERAQYEEIIIQQYAPALQKKEDELSRRLGREIRLEPQQDPDFLKFRQEALAEHAERYEQVLEDMRMRARSIFEGSV